MDYNSINNMLSGLQVSDTITNNTNNNSRVKFNTLENQGETVNNSDSNNNYSNDNSNKNNTSNKIQFSALSRDMELKSENNFNFSSRPDFTKSQANNLNIRDQNNERLDKFPPMTQCIGYTHNPQQINNQIDIDNKHLRFGKLDTRNTEININDRMNQRGMMPNTSNFMINKNSKETINGLNIMSNMPVNTKIQISDMFKNKESK